MPTMTIAEREIDVAPGSELDHLLTELNGATTILLHGDRRYRLAPMVTSSHDQVTHDSERMRKTLAETAGALAGRIDPEALKAEIRAGRGHVDDSDD